MHRAGRHSCCKQRLREESSVESFVVINTPLTCLIYSSRHRSSGEISWILQHMNALARKKTKRPRERVPAFQWTYKIFEKEGQSMEVIRSGSSDDGATDSVARTLYCECDGSA